MTSNIQYECLDEHCRTVIVYANGKYLDGRSCPRCKGPIVPTPFVELVSKTNEDATLAVYQCLCCNHSERVRGKKEDYSEVKVCPRCNGAFVDAWKIAQYKQVKPTIPKPKPNVINITVELDGKQIAQFINSSIGMI